MHSASEAVMARDDRAASRVASEPAVDLDVQLHDSGHLEWEVSAPLPAPGHTLSYQVRLRIEVPDASWTHHDPWHHFRARSRLQAPRLGDVAAGGAPADLRRATLGAVRDGKSSLSRARRAMRALLRGEVEQLAAVRTHLATAEARLLAELPAGPDEEPVLRMSEEYRAARWCLELSNLLAWADRTCPPEVAGQEWQAARDAVAARALEALENARRKSDFDPADSRGQEGFLRRAGQLKRKFHRHLFLDAEILEPDRKFGHLIAAFVAILASTWAFIWQIAWANQYMSSALPVTTLCFVGVVAGVLYAVKDRIKEVGRRWLSSRLRQTYADRIVKLRLLEEMDHRQPVIARSLESIRVTDVRTVGEDRVTTLEVLLRLKLYGRRAPLDGGMRRIKHFLRYDFSQALVGMERAPHPLAVPDANGGVRILQVPKTYAMPLRCEVMDGVGRVTRAFEGTLVAADTRLVRLERTVD